VSDNTGVLILGEDAILKGDVKNAKRVEVRGYAEGEIAADDVVVRQGGRLYGGLKSKSAEVSGTLQGDVRVQELISIKSSGSVTGNVKYGRLAMEEGAELTASVRNVPPSIGGDLDLAVDKGRSVRITLADLSALDPDDKPENLIFSISNLANGFVTLAAAPGLPVEHFTQADLEGGKVFFAHDGTASATAAFDVVVTDHAGATSGAARTVKVAVRP
jgi:cytoskeletal protein CcmA (bactofilin family)